MAQGFFLMPDRLSPLMPDEADERKKLLSNSRTSHGTSISRNDSDQPCEEAGTIVSVRIDEDLYCAVVVAAFTNYSARVGSSGRIRVHPLVFLFFACLLFCCQFFMILFLTFDMEVGQEIWTGHAWKLDSLLLMKFVMILILQVVLFQEIISVLGVLVFLLNPTTWTDVSNNDRRGQASREAQGWNGTLKKLVSLAFGRPVVLPCAVIAAVLKLIIGYLVSTLSLSIILQTESAKEAIFDSLTITFITELDSYALYMLSTIYSIDRFDQIEHFEDMEVKAGDPRHVVQRRHQLFGGPETTRFLLWRHAVKYLTRSHYGRHVEKVVVLLLTSTIYLRQLLMVLYSLDTNVLPTTRDTCTAWRWKSHKDKELHNSAYLFRALHLSDHPALDREIAHLCTHPRYDRMRASDMYDTILAYPLVCSIFFTFVVIIFLAPTITSVLLYGRESLVQPLMDDSQEVEDE
uniref:Uncharacterized protein n=1 Tax=Noctiluca scintillans TaxID=2966 RepID=A0A7S1A025_NOCSC